MYCTLWIFERTEKLQNTNLSQSNALWSLKDPCVFKGKMGIMHEETEEDNAKNSERKSLEQSPMSISFSIERIRELRKLWLLL